MTARTCARAVARVVAPLALVSITAAATAAPEIQHWRTANGARVYFVAARELPIADVRVVFDAGSARDGAAPGLAYLTNAALDAGTRKRDGRALHERLAALGAQLDARTERDSAWVSLRSLSDERRLAEAAALLAEVIAEPALEPDLVARERERQRVHIEERTEALGERLLDRLHAAVYGEHPYARPVAGTSESVVHLEAEDVRAFHERYYVAANAVVAIVGDLSRARAETLAERVTAGLARGAPAPPLPASPAGAPAAALVREVLPSTQTHIGIGQVGVREGDPDYFALYVANHVLGGGGFISRLFNEIRERRGLSYSAWSYFLPQRRAGLFAAVLATRNDQVGEALSALRATFREFREHGPTAEELERSKENIIGGFPLRIDSNAEMLEQIARIGFYGLPLDYLETYPDRIAAVTREAAHEAFRRRMDPERQVIAIVGAGAQDEGLAQAVAEPAAASAAAVR